MPVDVGYGSPKWLLRQKASSFRVQSRFEIRHENQKFKGKIGMCLGIGGVRKYTNPAMSISSEANHAG